MIDLTIIVLLILIIFIYYLFNTNGLIKIKNEDNHIYWVRNLPDKKDAVQVLSTLRNRLEEIINYLLSNVTISEEYKKYITIMKEKLKTVIIKETPENSPYTSYSINKGQELVFCIRSKKNNKLHDINDLIYVAIHELAHIGCPEIGHTKLFFNINLFILKEAVKFNLYKYNNYDKNPIEYCGIDLNHNILN